VELPRRLPDVCTLSVAPEGTLGPSWRCWCNVRLLSTGVLDDVMRAEVTPAGPQLPPIASTAMTAANTNPTRVGIIQPVLRTTGTPAKSRLRRSRHEAATHTTIHTTEIAIPASTGP